MRVHLKVLPARSVNDTGVVPLRVKVALKTCMLLLLSKPFRCGFELVLRSLHIVSPSLCCMSHSFVEMLCGTILDLTRHVEMSSSRFTVFLSRRLVSIGGVRRGLLVFRCVLGHLRFVCGVLGLQTRSFGDLRLLVRISGIIRDGSLLLWGLRFHLFFGHFGYSLLLSSKYFLSVSYLPFVLIKMAS